MITPEDEDVIRRGKSIYEQRLRKRLETEHRGEYLVIDPDTEEYYLGRTPEEAMKAALAVHPDHLTYAVRVGYDVSAVIGGGWS